MTAGSEVDSMISRYWKLGAVAISCVAIGAGASAIASAGAATAGAATTITAHAKGRALTARGLLARSVHGDLVVATKGGFATVTLDRGIVQSVSGQQLTLREGTKKATYKTVTLTIPANARIRDDRHRATLADVKSGQRVVVLQGPKRTLVVARTPRNG